MKKITAAAVVLSAFASPAAFAGNWGGAYVGAAAGAVEGVERVHSDETGYPARVEPSGFAYGLLAGMNSQQGKGVMGVELELGMGSADESLDRNDPANDFGYTISSEINQMDRMRVRLGYDLGKLMPFVASGVSLATTTVSASDGSTTDHYSINRTGFNVGAGVDYAVTDRLNVRAEYIDDKFGSAVFNSYNFVYDTWDLNLRTRTLRIAGSLKF